MEMQQMRKETMKGIMQQIQESKAEPIDFSRKITYQELLDWFKESDERYTKIQAEKRRRSKENSKFLNHRAKVLGKEVPCEVWFYLVGSDHPVGSWFFEKYREWLSDEPIEPEEPTTTDMVLQHAINNFPVRK